MNMDSDWITIIVCGIFLLACLGMLIYFGAFQIPIWINPWE